MKVIFLKKHILLTNILIFTFIIFLLTNSSLVVESITNSTKLFVEKILPALFIYIFLTELLINFNLAKNLSIPFSKIISKLFIIPESSSSTVVIGLLLGYPNSAKYIKRLYEQGKITESEANKLVAFTSNANMSYIVCTIGILMFNNISYGIILTISHFLASIILGIVIKTSKPRVIIQQTKIKENSFKKIYSYFDVITLSVLATLKTLGLIFSYTIIFSLIPTLFLNYITIPEIYKGLITGIFELSNGIKIISNLNINITTKLVIISFILSFSSLMVIMQIYSFVYKAKVKFLSILKHKFMQGIISSTITYILLKIIKVQTVPVFSNSYELTKNLIILPSTIYMFFVLFTIILLSFLYRKKRQLTCRLKRGILKKFEINHIICKK